MSRTAANSAGAEQSGHPLKASAKHWVATQGPSERLLAHGAQCLSDAELLAVILRTGLAGADAVGLSAKLLEQWGSLDRLLAAEPEQLLHCYGIGPARQAQLLAIRALAERLLVSELRQRDTLNSTAAVRAYLGLRYRRADREVFSCFFLDSQHGLLRQEELFIGTIDGAAVYPREVVKRCLATAAAAVIFAHNHPSGVAEPSQADLAITRRLQQALATIDVRVLDHLVIGDPEIVSFAERGLL